MNFVSFVFKNLFAVDLIMDQSAEKQAQINRRRDEMAARTPAIWDKLFAEWNSPGPEDRAWLMYSANYLFRTQGVRWAMDPLALNSRLLKSLRTSA